MIIDLISEMGSKSSILFQYNPSFNIEKIQNRNIIQFWGKELNFLKFILNQIKEIIIKFNTSNTVAVITGGAPVHSINRQFIETFPSLENFFIGYGSTELGKCVFTIRRWTKLKLLGPTVTQGRSEDALDIQIKSAGTPMDHIEIKIMDRKTKKLCKIGETGEVHARGHPVMIGYWNDRKATREVISETGWYATGWVDDVPLWMWFTIYLWLLFFYGLNEMAVI